MPTKKKKKFKAKNQVEQGEILPCALQTTSLQKSCAGQWIQCVWIRWIFSVVFKIFLIQMSLIFFQP